MPSRKTSTKSKTKTKPVAANNRQIKTPNLKWYELIKGSKLPRDQLIGAFRLFYHCLDILKRYWKPFLIITLIYGLLNVVLVRGLAGGLNLSQIKSSLDQTGQISTGLTLFVYLLGGSGNSSSANAGVYQTILIIVISLATIWMLRQTYLGVIPKVREAFYKGMYPVIPFLLVLLVIGLQLIPLLIGATIYSLVVTNGIAVGLLEHLLWIVVFAILALVSLYWVCSSIFALYIVTLPDMTPMKALRSARQLVKFRRLLVIRKILFLPLALLIIALVIMVPFILIATPLAVWLFFILTMLGLIVIHSYMYALYRELLR